MKLTKNVLERECNLLFGRMERVFWDSKMDQLIGKKEH
jgi:hypothetical protein